MFHLWCLIRRRCPCLSTIDLHFDLIILNGQVFRLPQCVGDISVRIDTVAIEVRLVISQPAGMIHKCKFMKIFTTCVGQREDYNDLSPTARFRIENTAIHVAIRLEILMP